MKLLRNQAIHFQSFWLSEKVFIQFKKNYDIQKMSQGELTRLNNYLKKNNILMFKMLI